MVQFDANPERFDSVKMLSILEDNVNACVNLNNQISQMEEEIILSPSYIKKSNSGAGGTNAPATPGGARSSELDDDIIGVGLGGSSGATASSSHHRSSGASSSMGSGTVQCSSSTTGSNSGAVSNHVNSAGVSGSNASSSNAVTQSSNMNGPA